MIKITLITTTELSIFLKYSAQLIQTTGTCMSTWLTENVHKHKYKIPQQVSTETFKHSSQQTDSHYKSATLTN